MANIPNVAVLSCMMSERQPLDMISLSGFKSIRNLTAFGLLSGLNVLIGANGSGKSNFIRFFELLGHLMDPNKGLQNYISARGRADGFLFRGMKVTPEMQAYLIFGCNEYKYSLKPADDRSLFFAHESAPFAWPWYGSIMNDQGSRHSKGSWVSQRV